MIYDIVTKNYIFLCPFHKTRTSLACWNREQHLSDKARCGPTCHPNRECPSRVWMTGKPHNGFSKSYSSLLQEVIIVVVKWSLEVVVSCYNVTDSCNFVKLTLKKTSKYFFVFEIPPKR